MRLWWRRRRSIVERVRPLLPCAHQGKVLRLADEHTVVKRASDGKVLGYHVTILLDPALGVP